MCKRLVILAQQSPTCYIAQCEHGTVHLCWENISIHLQPADFLGLTATISDMWTHQPDHRGKMRLGIGNLILEVPADDCRPMHDLMGQAAAQLPIASVSILEYGAQLFSFHTKQCLN